jgi:hypothetical protein
MPKLILQRKKNILGRGRTFKIFIDGKETDAISAKGSKEFDLPAGPHTLQVKFGRMKSDVKDFTLSESLTLNLRLNKFYEISVFTLLLILISRRVIPHDRTINNVAVVYLSLIGVGLLILLYFITFGRKQLIVIEEMDWMK